MTEGFQDIEGRIDDVSRFTLMKIWSNIFPPLGESIPIAEHNVTLLALFSVCNLYLKNMYRLNQMLPVPKVTLW